MFDLATHRLGVQTAGAIRRLSRSVQFLRERGRDADAAAVERVLSSFEGLPRDLQHNVLAEFRRAVKRR